MSKAYLCAPVTMARPSTFGTEVPATFHSAGAASATLAGMVRVSFWPWVSSPKPAERLPAVTRPSATAMEARSTAHFCAARSIEHLARRRGGPADLRPHARRGHAAQRSHIERRERGVAHHQIDGSRRHVQFFGRGLGQRGARVLPHLHLAGVDRDRAVFADVQPGVDLLRHGAEIAGTAPAAAARFLRQNRRLPPAAPGCRRPSRRRNRAVSCRASLLAPPVEPL